MDEELKKFWYPYEGAVSLTFDDGAPSQLEKAIPVLNDHSIKGTFYLVGGRLNTPEKIEAWQKVSAAGHEIGNHSFSHCASTNFGDEDGLEKWTLNDIEEDILRAQKQLEPLFPNQKDWTYCYPCYLTDVGMGASRKSYVPVVAKHFLAGRGKGEYPHGNHPFGVDLSLVWGHPVEQMSAQTMIGLVETQVAHGRWVVLVFHRIEDYRISVQGEDFLGLIEHLSRHRDRIWTAPMCEVAKKIHQYQNERKCNG